MATFLRTTAPHSLRTFAQGASADLLRHPHALVLVTTFVLACVHAATL